MRGRGAYRRHRLVVAVILTLAAGSAGAQPTAAPTPGSPSATPAAIAAADLPQRIEETLDRVRQGTAGAAGESEVAAIREALPRVDQELESLRRDARIRSGGNVTFSDLEDARRQWLRAKQQLGEWAQALAAHTRTIDAELADVSQLDATWAATEAAAEREALPEALRARIRAVREAIATTMATLRRARIAVLDLQGAVAERGARVAEELAVLDARVARLRKELLQGESDPLTTSLAALQDGRWREAAREAWRQRSTDLAIYVAHERWRLATHGALFLLALVAATQLRRRSHAWPLGDPVLAAVKHLRDRPVSAAAVVTLLLTPAIHPGAPAMLLNLNRALLVLPVLRLLQVGLFTGLPSIPAALAAVLVADAARDVLLPLSPLARVLLVIENLGVVACLLWLLRPTQLTRLRTSARWRLPIALVGRGIILALLVAVVADVVGRMSLASVLTEGALRTIYAGVVLHVVTHLLDGLLVVFLHSSAARSLRAVQRHAPLLRRRGIATIHTAALAAWIAATLYAFTALDTAVAALRSGLAASVEVGSLSLSVGDVLALVVTIGLSVLIARLVRFVLEEDVLPRLSLPRGVPGAISVGATYAIGFLGFFAALSAAGVEFGRLTVLLGAFGVGLSFGLQNIVNNFVSGLILVFERPIQIGDTIEIGDVKGQVRNIGIRSSTLRTFDGAEVIVPNGTLLSGNLINWTLSDRQRRVEVTVGVAYGTDPARVVALLLETAERHPAVLRIPPPAALFLRFGESSLDFALRAWTADPDTFMQVQSDLGIAVYAALREAGIDIPFPQRDLHVRSVDPSAEGVVAPPAGDQETSVENSRPSTETGPIRGRAS